MWYRCQESLTIHSTGAGNTVASFDRVEVVGELHHGSEALLHGDDVLNVLGILGLDKGLEEVLHGLTVLHPLVKKGLGRRLLGLLGNGHGLDGRLAAGGGLSLGHFSLALTSLGRLGGSAGGRATGASVVVVDALHVVSEVPLAGESISGHGTLTSLVDTKERLVTMAMKSVGLTLMAEEASSRREAGALARLSLAAVGLQVRVHEFADGSVQSPNQAGRGVLTHSCT